jgi:hypothetical protein
MKRLITLAALLISFTSFAQQRDKSFDTFWTSFRAAVLASDVAALDPLVSYPLTVKGTQDTDPVKKINRDKIVATLKTYMSKFAVIEDGFDGETNRDQIKRYVTLPPSIYRRFSPADVLINVGDLDFKKIGSKWKLSIIIYEFIRPQIPYFNLW